MNPKITIVLLILLAVMGLIIAVSQLGGPEETAPPEPLVFHTTLEPAGSLEISSPNGPTLRFVRDGDQWTMTEPVTAPAAEGELRAVLSALRRLEYVRTFTPGQQDGLDDSLTGLDAPIWAIHYTDLQGKTHSLKIGRKVPQIGGTTGTGETYVRPDDEKKTYVAAVNFAEMLNQPTSAWRDKTLLSFDADQVVAIDLAGRASYQLEKQGNDWTLTRPEGGAANPSEVTSLLERLNGLTAERILAEAGGEDLSAWGLDDPQLRVTLTMGASTTQPDGKPAAAATHTLLLGNRRGDHVVAKLAEMPTIVSLPAEMIDQLQPRLDKLRSKSVFDFSPAEVTEVRIDRNGQSIVLQKTDGRWQMVAPQSGPAERGSIMDMLNKLASLQARQWIRPQVGQSIAIRSPRATVTLQLTDRDEPMQLLVGSSSGEDSTYVQAAGSAVLAEVLTADISELLRPAGAYWSRRLMSVPAGQDVVAVNIDRADGGWNLIRTAEGWRIVAPQPGQANPDRIDAILDILRAPRAERIVALGEVPSTYREANDIITVLINTRSSDLDPPAASQPAEPQTADHHLTLVKTDEGTFAWTPDADVPAVGRIDEKLWDLLSGDLTTPPPSPEPPMPPGGGPMGPGGMMPIPPQ